MWSRVSTRCSVCGVSMWSSGRVSGGGVVGGEWGLARGDSQFIEREKGRLC